MFIFSHLCYISRLTLRTTLLIAEYFRRTSMNRFRCERDLVRCKFIKFRFYLCLLHRLTTIPCHSDNWSGLVINIDFLPKLEYSHGQK